MDELREARGLGICSCVLRGKGGDGLKPPVSFFNRCAVAYPAPPLLRQLYGVFLVVQVPVFTLGFNSVNCGRADAAKHILFVAHGFQVIGADATPYPAKMVDYKPFGDRPFKRLVGISVCRYLLCSPANPKFSVATPGTTRCPKPTTTRLFHFGPKKFFRLVVTEHGFSDTRPSPARLSRRVQ